MMALSSEYAGYVSDLSPHTTRPQPRDGSSDNSHIRGEMIPVTSRAHSDYSAVI